MTSEFNAYLAKYEAVEVGGTPETKANDVQCVLNLALTFPTSMYMMSTALLAPS